MKTKGIRISDKVSSVVSVRLEDILDEINEGKLFQWSILFLNGIGINGNLYNGRESLLSFQDEIKCSQRGIFINWDYLKLLATKFHQIIDISLIGCKNQDAIFRYKSDQEMYESCDYIIEMIDSSYWEVFSFDLNFIDRLSKKFKETKLLESNFQDEWLKKI